MIFKRVFLTAGLLTCLAAAANCFGQSNVMESASASATTGSTNYSKEVRAARAAARAKIGQLGDPAPPLTVQEWVKGKPVKIQPGTNIYVIVFCTLTRAGEFALTNLYSLQKQYGDKGVVTLIISDDPPQQLREFIQMRGADINSTVAADDLARKTTAAYQRVFNDVQTPRAYIVGKDASILWYGHPLRDGMGEVVDQIVSGKYDLELTKKNVRSRQQMDIYLAMARQDDPRTTRIGQLIFRARTNDAVALCDLAFQIATDTHIEKRDTVLANLALDRAEQISSTNATDIAVDRAILVFQTGSQEAGLAKAKEALAIAKTEDEKGEVTTCIKAMEVRIAQDKTNQVSAVKAPPGGTNSPAGKP